MDSSSRVAAGLLTHAPTTQMLALVGTGVKYGAQDFTGIVRVSG